MKMRIRYVLLICLILTFPAQAEEGQEGLKVFISVDMEGVSGVIHWEDVSRNGKDYNLFRRLMTEEANAAKKLRKWPRPASPMCNFWAMSSISIDF